MALQTAFARGFWQSLEYDNFFKECRVGEFHVIRMYTLNVDEQILTMFLNMVTGGKRKLSEREKKALRNNDKIQ